MSSQMPYSPNSFSEVFYDTSVLLNFALSQDNGQAKQLLTSHSSINFTGTTVEREFKELKNRRKEVIKSIYKCDDLSGWNPPPSVDMSPNDRDWCASLLADLDQIATREDIEDRLDLEERRLNRGFDILFEQNNIINTVWPNNLDSMLLGSLRFIGNNNDRHVVCESADWASDSASDNLITADSNDLLSNRQRISDTVDMNRDLESLHLFSAQEFLSADPNFQP